MRARVERYGVGYIVRGQLYQSDWDFPRLAQDLGWSLTRVQPDKNGGVRVLQRRPTRGTFCPQQSTDGTTTCRECGVTASDFIRAAAQYLDALS